MKTVRQKTWFLAHSRRFPRRTAVWHWKSFHGDSEMTFTAAGVPFRDPQAEAGRSRFPAPRSLPSDPRSDPVREGRAHQGRSRPGRPRRHGTTARKARLRALPPSAARLRPEDHVEHFGKARQGETFGLKSPGADSHNQFTIGIFRRWDLVRLRGGGSAACRVILPFSGGARGGQHAGDHVVRGTGPARAATLRICPMICPVTWMGSRKGRKEHDHHVKSPAVTQRDGQSAHDRRRLHPRKARGRETVCAEPARGGGGEVAGVHVKAVVGRADR